MPTILRAAGHYLPSRIMTNADLAQRMETTDEWIASRTGIRQRHIAADGELTSDLATAAAKMALSRAGLQPTDVDLIIVATTTPDLTFPATACRVQQKLGAGNCPAFDMQAVCSGFIYALSIADSWLKAHPHKTALVIGAETLSRIMNWDDRGTAILFGDGAGAVVLQSVPDAPKGQGILSTHLYADGRQEAMLRTSGGVSTNHEVGFIEMQGREVYKYAVINLAQAVDDAMSANGLTGADLDWLVPHQANVRIIESMADRLQLPMNKVVVTIGDHANTSAASIPLALSTAMADGRIQAGQLILMEAMGGGFTWGSALVRV